MSKVIKLTTLIELDACPEQVVLFSSLFGEKVTLTEEIVISNITNFDLDWVVRNLLPYSVQKEYVKITTPAWREYDRVTAPAWIKYVNDIASNIKLKACNKNIIPALEEYQKTIAPAREKYNKVKALAFYRLYDANSLKKADSLIARLNRGQR